MLKAGKAVYHINRIVEETGVQFGDGAHIIYVNGEYRGNTPLGDLMHDFNCSNPEDMKIRLLADRARYLKEGEKGEHDMCREMKELIKELYGEEIEEARQKAKQEAKQESRQEMIIGFLKLGKLTLEEIATASEVSVEDVKQIAERISVKA